MDVTPLDRETKARLQGALENLPEEALLSLPRDAAGEVVVDLVHALYRYEHPRPGEVVWTEVRELTKDDWREVSDALGHIYRATHSFDGFPSFAWGDLREVRTELLRQLREQPRPDEWMMQLLDYRLLNFSTSLRLYHEHVMAQVNRDGDKATKTAVSKAFSEVYDRSFAYRLLYSLRNAFQHGVRGLITLRMTIRLVEGSDTEREAEAYALLQTDTFVASRANAAVRREVQNGPDDVDLLVLSEEAYDEVRALHSRLLPLLHPEAPASAEVLIRYITELRGARPFFHQYIREHPARGLVQFRTLDRDGFAYVARVAGRRATFEDGPPPDALGVLPSYPSHTGG